MRDALRTAKRIAKRSLLLSRSYANNLRYRQRSRQEGEDAALAEKESYVFSDRGLDFYRVRPIHSFLREQIHASLQPVRSHLDIGCNAGQETYLVTRDFPDLRVHGVDFNAEAIDFGRRHFQLPNLEFSILNTLKSELVERFAQDPPDLISCFEVIEHLTREQMRQLFANLHAISTPRTVLLFSTPNGHYADDGHQHVQFFSVDSLERALQGSFEVGRVGKFRYNPVMDKTHDILFAVAHKRANAAGGGGFGKRRPR